MNAAPEIVIVGAGPYGLSIAAGLRAQGINFRIFGKPMHSWRAHMPQGMFLKSDGFASNLFDPQENFTLKNFCQEQAIAYDDERLPVRLDTFCAYGLAFQQRLVPEVEDKQVISLAQTHDGFIVRLNDGEVVTPRKVILAVGIHYFQYTPEPIQSLPSEAWSHSAQHHSLAAFHGREVTVIGAGSSALDVAGLLRINGAQVRLVARRPSVAFHSAPCARSWWQRMRHPKSGLGTSLRSRIVADAPLLVHYLPQNIRLRIARNLLGPSGGWFVREQVIGKVPLLLNHTLQRAQMRDQRVHLSFRANDGSEHEISSDHVIAATGYRADLRRLPFLDSPLLQQIRCVQHTPQLSANFESSVAGLYFVGPIALNSFGPLMRFVFGARFTAQRLCAHLTQPTWRLAPRLATS